MLPSTADKVFFSDEQEQDSFEYLHYGELGKAFSALWDFNYVRVSFER